MHHSPLNSKHHSLQGSFLFTLEEQVALRPDARGILLGKEVWRRQENESSGGSWNGFDQVTTTLQNGDSVFIIEVKYRVHPKDIETLIHRKGGNFPLLFPQYRDFQRHLGLATFSIEDAVLEEALD